MIRIFLFALLFPFSLFAQFSDDFSDGNLSTAPPWTGDTAMFSIANGQLKLTAPAVSGSAIISTTSKAIYKTVWACKLFLDFNPSSANFVRIYLTATQNSIDDQFKGYFLEIGSADDDVSLYRQSGTSSIKLIDGVDGRLNFSAVQVAVRVETDEAGNWYLYTDTGPSGPTGIYAMEGTVNDLTHVISNWFMLQCIFTSTRSDKFRFDDMRISGSPLPDFQNPKVEKIRISDSKKIEVYVSEPVNLPNPQNFELSTSNNPIQNVSSGGEKIIVLQLLNQLEEGENHYLKISGITDLSGNLARDTIIYFDFYLNGVAGFRDILINEILADPDPAVAIPLTEYVELYNRSEFAVNLSGWIFSDHTTFAKLSEYELLPESIVIISACASDFLPGVTNKICLEKFPTLNNSGDRLLLLSSAGTIIDSVNYQNTWHAVSEKANGGWSLELIDPKNVCKDSENWTSSISPQGGTPGTRNSVLANIPDILGPEIYLVDVLNDSTVQFQFNERLNWEEFSSINLNVQPPCGDLKISRVNGLTLRMDLKNPLLTDQVYRINFSGLKDCLGNRSQDNSQSVPLLISAEPEDFDVIVNEIMFNPRPGSTDYVEIYNRSTRPLNLKNWFLRNEKEKRSGVFRNSILYSRAYLVITDDEKMLKAQFPFVPDSLLAIQSLPSMPDDEGYVMLCAPSGRIIDSLYYNRNFHLRLIKDDQGISLERLSADEFTSSKSNWISAGLGGGSPGFRNSVSQNFETGYGFRVEPEVFSCRTGNCHTSIFYQVDDPDMMINISVLNYEGQLINTLCQNEHISGNGFIRWDGDLPDGSLASPGLYVIESELFNTRGYFSIIRRRAVIMP